MFILNTHTHYKHIVTKTKHALQQVVYKLTDFGYAKSYDQNSVCNSLVGTIQYVAPEVLNSTEYRSSVSRVLIELYTVHTYVRMYIRIYMYKHGVRTYYIRCTYAVGLVLISLFII